MDEGSPADDEIDLRDDVALLRSSAEDPAAFATFYRRHAEAIATYHARRVGPPDVVAELVAETFARALEGRRRLDPTMGDAGAVGWLYGIARNVLREHWRRDGTESRLRARLRTEARVDGDGQDHTEDVLDRLHAADVVPLLQELPARQREAIRLRILEESEYPEVAAALDTSVGNARVVVHRALRLLAERIEDES